MVNSDLEAEGLISNWNKINLDVTFTYECFLPQSFSDYSLDAVRSIFLFLMLIYIFDYQAV